MSQDTTPAVETDIAEPTSLTEALSGDRHQALAEHEPEREAGEPKAAPAPAVVAPSAQPAPTAATQAPPAAAAGDLAPTGEPKPPKWFREAMAEKERENLRLRSELEGRPTGQPAPRQQPQERPALPNPAEDPEGYHRAITSHFSQELAQTRLETTLTVSERFARQQHGGDAFEECKAWLSTQPRLEAMFIQEPDPWGSALAYFQREKLTEEIGDDPAAYRRRIEDAAIAAYEARLQAQQDQHQPAPRPAPQMRSAPPYPASTARNAASRDDQGRFSPTPLSAAFKAR